MVTLSYLDIHENVILIPVGTHALGAAERSHYFIEGSP